MPLLGCNINSKIVTGKPQSIIFKPLKQLDQVYCAWLIKWVVKREIIQLAELCLSRWWIKSGTWWYWISIWRYWLVLGQYKLELLGFRWYRVSKGLVCLYILEKVEIWSGVTDAWHTYRQQNIGLHSTCLPSIKFKLSHAIRIVYLVLFLQIMLWHTK